jgi:plasmid stabilization system protein ParE
LRPWPQERYILSEFDLKGRVELIATHGSSTFYVFRTREGSVCYSIGQRRKGLTPAQTELRPRFGSLGCLRRGMFPSRALPVKPKKPTRSQDPVVVQRGTANGVTVVVRGTEIEARFDGMPAAALKLLKGRRGRITVGCFRLVTFAGRRFSDGAAVSRTFATFVRARLFSKPGRRFAAPFDGCIATGIYGHSWNDAHGTHDLVEIPLTAKGRGFFAERAAARDIAWLARARVFKAVRYTQRPFTPATAAAYLAERVDPLEGPSDTPPLGRLGIWLGPDRRIVLVERAPTGRRLFLELRRGVIYRTNLGGLTQVL